MYQCISEAAAARGVYEGDALRVKQILINLLSNAVRVTKAKGKIEVEVAHSAQGHAQLTVRDNGPGMEPERVAHLFDAFFRSGSAGGDSALGLSLVKRFVELHGGHVHVESTLGVGTAITCVFPRPKSAAA